MDKKPEKNVHRFGLIGRKIDYSFSRKFFSDKFEREQLPYSYENFDLDRIEEFPEVLNKYPDLKGLNVTIPYKEAIIPFLDELHITAKKIGAVNTIKFTKTGRLKGYNTDAYGFRKSLEPYLKSHHRKALILGTGGASKAITYVLQRKKIEFQLVSRKGSGKGILNYQELDPELIRDHKLIINCTPLGTFPDIHACPDIPYSGLTDKHLLYDLVYNPVKTTFMERGLTSGAQAYNGLRMLELQALKAWAIWMPEN